MIGELVVYAQENRLSAYPEGISENVAQLLALAGSGNTNANYKSQCTKFAKWCQSTGRCPLPASELTMLEYVAYLAGSNLKVSTIRVAVAAIGKAHDLARLDSPVTDVVKRAINGVSRSRNQQTRQARPATTDVLGRMLEHCDDSLTGTRDRALLLMCFAGAFRQSELVAIRTEDLTFADGGVYVRVRRSKTDQAGRGEDKFIPAMADGGLCAVGALRDWLESAGIENGPIFVKIFTSGNVGKVGMLPKAFSAIVKKYAQLAGYDPDEFSGHSMRRGFVTAALEGGADISDVMAVTLHTDPKTVQLYRGARSAAAGRAVRTAMSQ